MKNNIQKAINEKTIKYYSYCRVGRQAPRVSDKSAPQCPPDGELPAGRKTGDRLRFGFRIPLR